MQDLPWASWTVPELQETGPILSKPCDFLEHKHPKTSIFIGSYELFRVDYLDDSGTHDSAKVLVWGGVAGPSYLFRTFDKRWNEQLQYPCDGKPPIKMFHSSHLTMGVGEFSGYNYAERDLTRRNFRQIIIESKLTWVTWGLSLAAWYKHAAADIIRAFNGKPEAVVFLMAIREFCIAARKQSEPISFQFDKGREAIELTSLIDAAKKSSQIGDLFVNFRFSPVKGIPGLQAADLVAHETYGSSGEFVGKRQPGVTGIRPKAG